MRIGCVSCPCPGARNHTANYSGNNSFGSEADFISVNAKRTAIASGGYVLPDVNERPLTVPARDSGATLRQALLTASTANIGSRL